MEYEKTDKVISFDSFQKNGHKLKKHLPYIIWVIFCLVVIALCAYVISPLSDVNTLSVKDNQEVPDQDLISLSSVRPEMSVLFTILNKKEFESHLESQHPQVKNVELSVENWNDVVFSIEEYQTVAYLAEDEQYYNVLETGEILDKPREFSMGNHVILSNFEEGDVLDRLLKELADLDSTIQESISEIEYIPHDSNEYRMTIYMNDGYKVYASIPTFADQMRYYPAMREAVEGRPGVFHLESGAYFEPLDSEDEETRDSSEEEEQQ